MNNNRKAKFINKDKRRGYESLLLLLLTIALFVTATYAWFTDSAYSRGNKLFAGNLYIDIVASKEDLIAAGHDEAHLTDDFGTPYNRKLVGGDSAGTDYYYVTDKEANVVNIYNMEPGQYRKVSVDYLNTGDLAFKTVGALKVEEQYNAFDTLIKQVDKDLEVYKNSYQVTDDEVVGNEETVQDINEANILLSGNKMSGLIEDEKNIVSINGVECIVLGYFDNELKQVGKDQGKLALMMTKDALATDVSFAGSNTSTTYENSNIRTFLNNVFTNTFESNPYIKAVDTIYYYGNDSHNKEYFGGGNINKPIFENEALSPNTLAGQHLFLPDAGLVLNGDMNLFNTGDKFFLNCSYHDGKAATGEEYKALIFNGNEQVTLESSLIESSGVGVRACFFYDLTVVNSSSSAIDPKTLYEDSNDENRTNDYYTTYEGLSYDDYLYRFNKIYDRSYNDILSSIEEGHDDEYVIVQEYVDDTENPGTYKLDEKGYLPKNYGHLSNVLEVYVTTDISEIEKGHDSAYYFGTVDQFAYLVEYGPVADETLSKATDITLDSDSPDNYYKILMDDNTANLYADYQRYLACGSGYCLPIDTVTNTETHEVDPNTEVRVYSPDVKGNYETVYASEMGSLEFLLYMPKEAGDEYQNCTLSLSLGGTATQVEYEVDDLGIMIYDKTKAKPRYNFNVGDIISLSPTADGEHPGYLRVLNKSGSSYDLAVIGGNLGTIPFFTDAIDDVDNSDFIYPLESSDRIPDDAYLSLYKGSALHVMNSLLAAEMCFEFDEYSLDFLAGDMHLPIVDGKINIDGKIYTLEEFKELIKERAKQSEDYMILEGVNKQEYTQDVYELVFVEVQSNGKKQTIECGIEPDYIIKDDLANPKYTYGVKKVDSIELDTVSCFARPLTIADIANALGKTTISFDEIDRLFYGHPYDEDEDYNPSDMWLGDAIYINAEVQSIIESQDVFDTDYPLALYLCYGDGIMFDFSMTIDKKLKGLSDFNAPYIKKEPSFVFTINFDETNYYFNKVNSWPEDFDGLTDGSEKQKDDDRVNVEFLLASNNSVYQEYLDQVTPPTISEFNYQVDVPNAGENILTMIEKYKDSTCDCYVIELPNDLETIKKVYEVVPSLNRNVYFIGANPLNLVIATDDDVSIEMLGATPNDYLNFFALNSTSMNFTNGKLFCSYIEDEQNQNYNSLFSTLISYGLNNNSDDGIFDLNTQTFIPYSGGENLAAVFKAAASNSEQIDTLVLPYVQIGSENSLTKLLNFVGTDAIQLTMLNDEPVKLDIVLYFMNRESVYDMKYIPDHFDEYNSLANEKLNSITVVYRDDYAIIQNLMGKLAMDFYAPSSGEGGTAIVQPTVATMTIITSYSSNNNISER